MPNIPAERSPSGGAEGVIRGETSPPLVVACEGGNPTKE